MFSVKVKMDIFLVFQISKAISKIGFEKGKQFIINIIKHYYLASNYVRIRLFWDKASKGYWYSGSNSGKLTGIKIVESLVYGSTTVDASYFAYRVNQACKTNKAGYFKRGNPRIMMWTGGFYVQSTKKTLVQRYFAEIRNKINFAYCGYKTRTEETLLTYCGITRYITSYSAFYSFSTTGNYIDVLPLFFYGFDECQIFSLISGELTQNINRNIL